MQVYIVQNEKDEICYVGIDPLDCSVEDAIKICDEFDKTKAGNQTTVFDIYPQIKQSNAINIVVTSLIDDFTTDPEAELNDDDLNDFAKILAKNRKCGYVTVFPTNKDNPFRKTFIEPNLNEKGFLRQDRFATELTTENGVKYMLFFPWSIINNQNAPYNEKINNQNAPYNEKINNQKDTEKTVCQ